MKNLIRMEELAMFGCCLYALFFLHSQWWYYPVMLLGPDISMLGYLAGNKIGAVSYNLFHHKGIAITVFVAGLIMNNTGLQLAGIVLFGHSSMDRFFGYGLKTEQGFKFTHLGIIGNK